MRSIKSMQIVSGLLAAFLGLMPAASSALSASAKKVVKKSQTAQQRYQEMGLRLIQLGKDALLKKDPYQAFLFFASAQRWLGPGHAEANFYTAVTRVLSLPMDEQPLFASLGFRGPHRRALMRDHLNPLQWAARLPHGVTVPATLSTGTKIQDLIAKDAQPALLESLDELQRIPEGFVSLLKTPNPLGGIQQVEIDDADVALFRAAIHLALVEVHLVQVYNADVDLRQALEKVHEVGVRQRAADLLLRYPAALRVRDLSQSVAAKQELLAAIADYLSADALMRAERDDQRDDLFSYSRRPQDGKQQRAFRQAMIDLRKSLQGLPDAAWTLTIDQVLDLGHFFNRPIDLRSLGTGHGVQELLLTHLLHQTSYALANLRKAPANFSQKVDPEALGFRSGPQVEVDFGDLLVLQAALESLQAAVKVVASYNLEINLEELAPKIAARTVNVPKDVLGRYPLLLRIQTPARLGEAKVSTQRALDFLLSTSDYLRKSEDRYQQDDLFPFQGDLARFQEPAWRAQALQLRSRLAASIDPNPKRKDDDIFVNLNPVFDGRRDPRDLLPKFQGNLPVPGTLPDPTLAGVVPDMKQQDWVNRVWPEKLNARFRKPAPPPPRVK